MVYNAAIFVDADVYSKRMRWGIALYWLPRIMGVAATLFISSFALDVWSGQGPLLAKVVGFVIHLLPSFVVMVALALAWRREIVGGIAFLLISAVPFVFLSNPLPVNAFLALPFALTGGLFLVSGRYARYVRE